MNLAQLLQDCESTEDEKRQLAETSLRECASQNPGLFILTCSQEFFESNHSNILRSRAALLIENTVRESANGADELWKSFDSEIRHQIKTNVLGTLAYPNDQIQESSAKLISLFYGIEFSSNGWSDLIPSLTQNATNIDPSIKQAAVLALRKVCEELERKKILIDMKTAEQISTGLYGAMKDGNDNIKLNSIHAYSCLLEIPCEHSLSDIVSHITVLIVQVLMETTQLAIQEEASIALLKTAENMPEVLLKESSFNSISENLITAISFHPKVSSKITKLWYYLGEELLSQVREKKQISYDISIVIDTLVKNSFRELDKEYFTVIDHSLLAASSLFLCISQEEIRKKYLLDLVLQTRKTKSFTEERRDALQGGLLLCIQNLLLQSEVRGKNLMINEIFKLLEEIFQGLGYVSSMGMGTLCSLISALGPDFKPYFEKSWVWIAQAFSRFDQPEFFDVGLNSIESLAQSCPELLKNYLSEIFTGLITLLDQPDFNKKSKLRIIGALGDISLGCGDLILPYAETLSRVYEVSMSAAVFNPEEKSELADYIRDLRTKLLESYTCFFHCVVETTNPKLILTSLPCVMEFIAVTSAQNYQPTPEYLRSALALVADVGSALKTEVKQYIKSDMTVYLVESLSKFSSDPENASTIDYAKSVLKNF